MLIAASIPFWRYSSLSFNTLAVNATNGGNEE
ncbi:Uncharacterised protein [Vibrio cholerae]|nr:Uncharacterised protein [Vibrio cholerae]CSI81325.1 Uncharacterised protein [Vibrio cholerae]